MQRRRARQPHPLRADLLNKPTSGPAPGHEKGERLFTLIRNAGRILGAFCGGLVIGCYLMGHDVTIPALAGAAFGVNELLYHLAESSGGRHRSAETARFAEVHASAQPLLARNQAR